MQRWFAVARRFQAEPRCRSCRQSRWIIIKTSFFLPPLSMPKGAPVITVPTSIQVAQGVVLWTTIDPLSKKHYVVCDICKKLIKLTKSAHPHAIFEHRKFCVIREGKTNPEFFLRGVSATSTSGSSRCPICPQTLAGEPRTIWKYNTISHLISEHPEPVPGIPNTYKLLLIPGQLLVDMFNSQQEETLMGIPKERTLKYRADNELPGSDDIQVI